MIELLDRTVEEVTRGQVFALLPDPVQEEIRRLSAAEIREGLRAGLTRPQPGDVSQAGRLLLNPGLAVQWLSAFEQLNLPRQLKLFEPCTGASEPVILAAEIYTGGHAEYTSLNLNRILAGQLRERIGKVRSTVRVIEDDVSRAGIELGAESFDLGCFHHAVNDILQTAVSEPRGMDTRSIEWWTNERQMIEWLAEDYKSGRIDERARPALVNAVRFVSELVKPGGYLLFDHWTWEAHRAMDWFPWELFCSLIPLAREWIGAADLPLIEVPLQGRDPQWWICYRRA